MKVFELIDTSAVQVSGITPWYIRANENLIVPADREMALHGPLVIDGVLTIETGARLRIEP